MNYDVDPLLVGWYRCYQLSSIGFIYWLDRPECLRDNINKEGVTYVLSFFSMREHNAIFDKLIDHPSLCIDGK